MRSSLSARFYVALVYVSLFVWWYHEDKARWNARGLDAFLRYRRAYFEHSIANPHSWLVDVLAGVIVLIPCWLVFELLAWAITAGLQRSSR